MTIASHEKLKGEGINGILKTQKVAGLNSNCSTKSPLFLYLKKKILAELNSH
jgi:hypothetical protein